LKKDIYHLPWSVYILECQDKTLYVGIALDVLKRLKDHNTTNKCRYTRSRKPLKLLYREECIDHHAAMIREREIKQFGKSKKLALIDKLPLVAG
jgi:putative endonuclease